MKDATIPLLIAVEGIETLEQLIGFNIERLQGQAEQAALRHVLYSRRRDREAAIKLHGCAELLRALRDSPLFTKRG